MTWYWWVAAIVSGLLLVGGSVLAYMQHRWLSRAIFVEGAVVELIQRPDAKGRPTYTPRVRYKTPDGQSHTFDANFSTNPAPYPVGAKVPVACDPESAQATIATFGASFGIAVVLFCLGLCSALVTAAFVLGPRWIPAIYMPAGNG